MKMQDLFVVTLAILLAAGVSLSQQSVGTASPAQSGASNNAASSSSPQQGELRTIVVAVKYYPINELGSLLMALSEDELKVITDEHSHRLILTGSAKRIEQVLRLIQELDVPNAESLQTQYLTYRVYMVELPAKDQGLKPFSILLERPSQVSSGQALDAAKEANIQIATLHQNNEGMDEGKWGLAIEGRAASNDAVKQMLAKIPDSQVREMKWDDETFTSTIPAAQVSRLPAQLQDHIRKFLGDEVQTVGYWFGNLSVPGEVEAPIGPWAMMMKAQSGQGTDVVLEVRVSRESRIPFVPETQLLSNTVQGRVGRPVIIGYNRESYGTRVMGVMVILLEADTIAPTTPTLVEAEKK